jgi:hypothetical protein
LTPIINEHKSEAKNTNKLATSSGGHIVYKHLPFRASCNSFLFILLNSPISNVTGVSIPLGLTLFTRIFKSPKTKRAP